jgi:hypothetical protein
MATAKLASIARLMLEHAKIRARTTQAVAPSDTRMLFMHYIVNEADKKYCCVNSGQLFTSSDAKGQL